MIDLIDRQAAISAICNACGKIDCDKMDKCEKLQLPPANCSEFPNNSDTISRQAVIDALGEKPLAWEQGEYEEGLQAQWESDVEAIKALPPAQLKRGKWIVKDDTERFIAQCNCCRYIEDSRRIKNFCPNCGADMRKEVKI